MTKVWKAIPLENQILEILESAGPCTDEEILKNLRKDDEVALATLYKTLLRLEVRGLVRVSSAPKGRKKIELAKR